MLKYVYAYTGEGLVRQLDQLDRSGWGIEVVAVWEGNGTHHAMYREKRMPGAESLD